MTSMLLREYVEQALYARGAGYFAAKKVVGGLRQPLQYKVLEDEADYRRAVRSGWETGEFGSAWLTPSEMFTPFYGEAVARSIVERHKAMYGATEPLQMLEVGGGNGTCASDVLRYLRREEPELYSSCTYTLVEISASLAEAQHARLVADLGVADGERFEVINECAHKWATERAATAPLKGPWWFNLFEVLDNLGHDKMRVSDKPDGTSECLEVVIDPADGEDDFVNDIADEDGSSGGRRSPLSLVTWGQSFRPLQDADLAEASALLRMQSAAELQAIKDELAQTEDALPGSATANSAQNFFGALLGMDTDVGEVFVPTGCWRMLRALCNAAPDGHQFTIADYSYLPPDPDGAINHPVVQIQNKGRTIDLRGNYLIGTGEADIMFPTNFDHLATMVSAASEATRGSSSQSAAVHMQTADFMHRWHELDATATLDGFNPLTDDFKNTRFLLTGPKSVLHA